METVPLFFLFTILSLLSIGYYKYGKGKIFLVVLLVYTLSSLSSIVYYNTEYFQLTYIGISDLSYFPFVYWLIVFVIISYPLIHYDSLKINRIVVPTTFVNLICISGLLLSIVPLIELIPHANKILQSSDLSSTFTDLHDEHEALPLSYIGSGCYKLLLFYFYKLILFCLIPVLINPRKYIYSLLGIISSILVVNLASMIISSRGVILQTILIILLVYILFIPNMNKQEKLKVGKYLLLVLSFVIILFMIITVYRNIAHQEHRSNYTLFVFLSRYAGEGLINFNLYIDEIKNHLNGEYCFWYIEKILGVDVHQPGRLFLISKIEPIVGIPMMVFYTFIGFFVIDFGYIGTMVLFSVISIIITKEMKVNRGILPLHVLFLIYLLSMTIVNGTCLYIFSWGSSQQLIFYIIIYFIIKYKVNKKRI